MIVLDASSAVDFILNTRAGKKVAEIIAPADLSLHAPHIIDLEVTQALRRYVRLKELTTKRAEQALADFLSLDLERYSHEPLLPRVWELRNNLTAYDAAYVALAELLDATLVTGDDRLAQAPGIKASVTLLK